MDVSVLDLEILVSNMIFMHAYFNSVINCICGICANLMTIMAKLNAIWSAISL